MRVISKIVNAALKTKAKAKAWTFEANAIGSRGRGQGHKIWPRGGSRSYKLLKTVRFLAHPV